MSFQNRVAALSWSLSLDCGLWTTLCPCFDLLGSFLFGSARKKKDASWGFCKLCLFVPICIDTSILKGLQTCLVQSNWPTLASKRRSGVFSSFRKCSSYRSQGKKPTIFAMLHQCKIICNLLIGNYGTIKFWLVKFHSWKLRLHPKSCAPLIWPSISD